MELNEKQDPLIFDDRSSLNTSHADSLDRERIHEKEKTRALVINLVKNTCKILEEEYLQVMLIFPLALYFNDLVCIITASYVCEQKFTTLQIPKQLWCQ